MMTKLQHLKKNLFRKTFLLLVSSFSTCLIFYDQTYAQNPIRITGKVVDKKTNDPVIGASVKIVGTTVGTTTGINGEFQITANNNEAVLQIFYLGYVTKQLPINGTTNFTVSLSPDVQQLEDVVVVGYGKQNKKNIVGSISTVTGDDIMKSNTPSMSNALAGRVTGLVSIQRNAEPGNDDAQLFIRGRATLNDAGPLVMVDGIQREFSQIDPNEVATLSILKDASSTAIYGARGANGVILVTTKKGISGKPTFNYNSYTGVQNLINTPDYLNSFDYARLWNVATLNDKPDTPTELLDYNAEDIQKYKDGSSPFTHPDVNWWKEVMKPNALQQRHSLSMTGGSETFKYFLSFGYLNQDGLYRTANTKRYNSRINIDANLTKTTTLSVGVSGYVQNNKRPASRGSQEDGGIFSLLSYMPPNAFPVKNEDGTWASLFGQNPVAEVSTEAGYRQTNPSNFQTNVTLDQKLNFITDGLTLKLVVAQDLGYSNFKDWYTPYKSFFKGEEFNKDQLPRLEEGFNKFSNQTFESHINYAKSFNKHDIGALVLYTQSTLSSNLITASRADFPSAALPQLFAGPRTNLLNNGSASEGGREGILGRLSYAYDKKYFIEASFGYNGSENFAPGKRFGFFPAVGLGWNIKSEKFLEKVNFINNLHIRGSYGQVGNDRVGFRRFLYLSPAYFGAENQNYVFGNNPVQTLRSGELDNPNVTWERAKKANIQLEADFMNNKLGFKLDLFSENRDNILANRNASVPATFGTILPVENIGKVANRGFEFELRFRNKIKTFTYFANATYTFARNKIIFIDEPNNIPEYQQRTGHPIDQFFGFETDGFYQTQDQIVSLPRYSDVEPKLGQLIYKDINGDGKISDLDRTAIGRSNTPESIFGLTFGGSFKGFDLNMLLQGASGYNVMRNEEAFFEFIYGGKALSRIKDNWTPENPGASYPRLSHLDDSYKRELSNFWLKNPTYLRLRNLELGYTFSLFKTKTSSKLRLSASGTNLLTFSKEKDFDPESNSGQPYFYPVTKLISVGANLSF